MEISYLENWNEFKTLTIYHINFEHVELILKMGQSAAVFYIEHQHTDC